MDKRLTPAAAQAMQDDTTRRGGFLVWIVTAADPAHPGQVMARAHTADHRGGAYLRGALIAETLEALCGHMPAGLTRQDRASVDPPEVLETWE